MSNDLLQSLHTRLALLRALEDGWYGPHSVRSSDKHLDFAESLLPFVSELNGTAALCSRESGEVVFEIQSGEWAVTAIIEDDNIYVVEDNVRTDELLEHEHPLTEDAFRKALSKYHP